MNFDIIWDYIFKHTKKYSTKIKLDEPHLFITVLINYDNYVETKTTKLIKVKSPKEIDYLISLRTELVEWLESINGEYDIMIGDPMTIEYQNTTPAPVISYLMFQSHIFFSRKSDAALFKLTWG